VRLRDLLTLGLLVTLGLILLPCVGLNLPTIRGALAGNEVYRDRMLEAVADLGDQTVSIYMLMSLGFLVALRCGAIDLSVWVVACVGGLVAAGLLNLRTPPWAALLGAVVVGAGVGAVNGLLVVRLRLPSVVITALVAILLTFAAQVAVPQRQIRTQPGVFVGWNLVAVVRTAAGGPENSRDEQAESRDGPAGTQTISAPLSVTRKLLAAGLYAVVVTVLANAAMLSKRLTPARRRRLLFAALCASGALAAAGGGLWLLDYAAAPVPVRPIGHLRVAAAALLAGGVFLVGRGRGALAAVCLLVAGPIVSIWNVHVWPVTAAGYSMQVLLLIILLLVVQLAGRDVASASGRRKGFAVMVIAAACAALLILACSARVQGARARQTLEWTGLAVSALGAGGLLLQPVVRGRRDRAGQVT